MENDVRDLFSGLGLDTDSRITRSKVFSELRIATVDANYSGSGRPKLLFAGESTVGSRLYPYLGSYTPAANDRVIVAMFSHSGCILGKIT